MNPFVESASTVTLGAWMSARTVMPNAGRVSIARRPTALNTCSETPCRFAKRVVIDGAADRPDQSHLVHDVRQIRKVLANLNAPNAGGNRPELTANLGRRIRLQVDQIDVRGSAREKNHDDRLARAALGTHRLCPQKISQRQAAHSQAADLRKRTAGNAVAQTIFLSCDGQHRIRKDGPFGILRQVPIYVKNMETLCCAALSRCRSLDSVRSALWLLQKARPKRRRTSEQQGLTPQQLAKNRQFESLQAISFSTRQP